MKGYIINIEEKALANTYFREVLYTDERVQLVVMSLLPSEDIGEEVHELDQFIRVEKGAGKAVLDGVEHAIADGSAIVIPKGTRHNIINSSPTEPLKLYTLYAPPDHKDKLINKTKADAIANDEPFNGVTSEQGA
jgi:mannose-6-phosphate isomerase-like protein (cupin superfamily)